ncbi:hypothetical protein AX16_007886 [Volvariella volvacea WC 439]|nr:hypothetical protein AX16_007886 [Volvariella volvacea WC 439]
MSQKINIFLTGATGYIGGAVLVRLLEHPSSSTFNITALVRNADKAAKLKDLGVNAVFGSLSDLGLLEELASQADFIFSTADSDNLPAVQAMLRGSKQRHQETGVLPAFIHTSGTGTFADSAKGAYASEVIYEDDNVEKIEAMPPTQIHRNVDLEIAEADKAGYVRTYIVLPATIWGLAKGKLVDLGIQNPHSLQIPILIRAALLRGQAGVVGEGKNVWTAANIEEVGDLYIVLFNAILSDPVGTPHGREGYYFGENGEYTSFEVSKAIGQALFYTGKSKIAEYNSFTEEELPKYFGPYYFLHAANTRCRAKRARALGWKPQLTTADMLASITEEIVAITSENSVFKYK